MRYLHIPFVAVALTVFGSCALAEDFVVISNPSLTASSVSLAGLKGLYLAVTGSLENGAKAEPILLKSGGAHEGFLKDCIGKSSVALGTYYRSLVFTGKGSMPKSFDTDAEVVEYVSKTKGAVGYVSAKAHLAGVKVLQINRE